MLKQLIKASFRTAGLKVSRIDHLEEAMPDDYNHSPFLPRVYRGSLDRMLYFLDQLSKVNSIEGDIVECGVSIGHGTLLFMLMSEYLGKMRNYYGFDSFAGFPAPGPKDETTPITGKGHWASPPDLVLKVLRDGRLPESVIQKRIFLTKGWFQDTLPKYQGTIALLHLDCDLYESYKFSLECLYDKVAPGGIIMFDEYNDRRWPGATKAIDEFFANRLEKPKSHDKCDWKYYVRKAH